MCLASKFLENQKYPDDFNKVLTPVRQHIFSSKSTWVKKIQLEKLLVNLAKVPQTNSYNCLTFNFIPYRKT